MTEPLEPAESSDLAETSEPNESWEPTGALEPDELLDHGAFTNTEEPSNHRPHRPFTSKRTLVSLAIVVVLTAVVVFVVHSTSPRKPMTPLEAVIAAELAAAKPSTMSFTLDASISTTQGSSFQVVNDSLKIFGTGAVDRANHSAAMNFTIKVSTLSVKIREVLSKKSVYVKFGALTPYLRSGKTWVQVPANVLSSKSSITSVSTSPLLLKQIREKEIKVTPGGKGTVNGVAVSFYKLKLNRAAVAALAGTPTTGTPVVGLSIIYTLAIDNQSVIRQIQMTLRQSVSNTHVLENMTMKNIGYNQPVVIDKPLTKLIEKLNAHQYARLERRAQTAPPSLV